MQISRIVNKSIGFWAMEFNIYLPKVSKKTIESINSSYSIYIIGNDFDVFFLADHFLHTLIKIWLLFFLTLIWRNFFRTHFLIILSPNNFLVCPIGFICSGRLMGTQGLKLRIYPVNLYFRFDVSFEHLLQFSVFGFLFLNPVLLLC